jgi:hypothetical protein
MFEECVAAGDEIFLLPSKFEHFLFELIEIHGEITRANKGDG